MYFVGILLAMPAKCWAFYRWVTFGDSVCNTLQLKNVCFCGIWRIPVLW